MRPLLKLTTNFVMLILFFLLPAAVVDADHDRQGIPVVATGIVIWSEAPSTVGLDGGWTVDLTDAQINDGCSLDIGSKLEVVGMTEPAVMPGLLLANQVRSPGLIVSRDDTRRAFVKSDDDEDETMTVEGVVVALFETSFEIETEVVTFLVEVDDNTEFRDVAGLDQLVAGNRVEVRGVVTDSIIVADRVKLLDDPGDDDGVDGDNGGDGDGTGDDGGDDGDDGGDDGDDDGGDDDDGDDGSDSGDDGIDFEYRGVLLELLPPFGFRMDDNRTYDVDDLTEYDSDLASYSGLVVGQILEVMARRLSGSVNRAIRIKLEHDGSNGGSIELHGEVIAISFAEIVLDTVGPLLLTSTTEFNGDADSWTEIETGWFAEVVALPSAGGVLVATTVRAEDPEPSTIDGEEYEPQQALVVIRSGSDPLALASRYSAVLVGEVSDFAILLWWPDEISDELLAALTADSDVRGVEPNYLFRDPESVRRRYPIVDRQASPEKFYEQPATRQVRTAAAHRLARGLGSVVAVVDTGVDPLHPVLEGRIVAGGLDLVDGDTDPWEERNGADDDGNGDIDEAAGHGTFVASIVALAAPDAAILPYRVLDDDGGGTAYHLALALADAIERRVDVISLSLVYKRRSSAVDLLLEEASARGIVVVASAGNDGSTTIPFPAADAHVIGVTALNEEALALSDFANRSPLLAVAAPGEEVYGGLDEQAFGTSSGTSMATPWVTATVALLLEVDEELDLTMIRGALRQAGTPVADALWDGVALDMAGTLRLVVEEPQPIARPHTR